MLRRLRSVDGTKDCRTTSCLVIYNILLIEMMQAKGFFFKPSLKNKTTVFSVGSRGDVLGQVLDVDADADFGVDAVLVLMLTLALPLTLVLLLNLIPMLSLVLILTLVFLLTLVLILTLVPMLTLMLILILQELEAPIIVPHSQQKTEQKYPFEMLFRSIQV